ncbi:MAG: AcrR family transcriptional regulator [Ilumatobacter sp.]|jgi:AcrR family transcriptional regulator
MFCHYSVDRPNGGVMTSEALKQSTAQRILVAARSALLESGFAAMSTRKVAERAGVPLSQIHYHFGSKEQLILTMLQRQNDSLVQRQADMFALDIPLSERWIRACDYLDEDLESGYVRVLQEMMAAGWSSADIRQAVNRTHDAWTAVLIDVAERAQAAGANLGPFTPHEIVALVASAFLGAESMLLLGRESNSFPIRAALRRIGEAIAAIEPPTSESSL